MQNALVLSLAVAMRLLIYCKIAVFLAASVLANTEKVIFLGRVNKASKDFSGALNSIDLTKLSPSHSKKRLSLPVAFPSLEKPNGVDSWYILSNLTQDQRYEVRVCWAAIVCVVSRRYYRQGI